MAKRRDRVSERSRSYVKEKNEWLKNKDSLQLNLASAMCSKMEEMMSSLPARPKKCRCRSCACSPFYEIVRRLSLSVKGMQSIIQLCNLPPQSLLGMVVRIGFAAQYAAFASEMNVYCLVLGILGRRIGKGSCGVRLPEDAALTHSSPEPETDLNEALWNAMVRPERSGSFGSFDTSMLPPV